MKYKCEIHGILSKDQTSQNTDESYDPKTGEESIYPVGPRTCDECGRDVEEEEELE